MIALPEDTVLVFEVFAYTYCYIACDDVNPLVCLKSSMLPRDVTPVPPFAIGKNPVTSAS